MVVLYKPATLFPENLVTSEQTLEIAKRLHADHPDLPLVLQLIRNTGVEVRNIVQSLENTLEHPGFEKRNKIHEDVAKRLVPQVVDTAIRNAGLTVSDIDCIIYVSCTGFMMPSMTAWMINELGFSFRTVQIPIAQLGCAGGGAAIARAADYCRAHPGSNVLIVSCEFCSLCYQPTDVEIGSLLSNGLFGDATAAVVVTDEAKPRGASLQLIGNASYIIPGTTDWISYAVRSTGFHFQLDRRVPGTMEPLAPVLREVAGEHGLDASNLDFYIIHAGGPRILDDLSKFLYVEPEKFSYSRRTLTRHGNIASAVVLDAMRRLFDDPQTIKKGHGIIAGFGPGITAEISIARWYEG
ncbi:type III polyketide synthase [Nocardia brevicatena]|uniref:type III polyketide synthase n=1 Tax=Nocardia brevicatena TaxID=37327 RepID=UPI000687E2AF|nr:type III polyketide synthase [Nocardia brevicatena]